MNDGDDVTILQPEKRVSLLKELTNGLYTEGIRQCAHETIADKIGPRFHVFLANFLLCMRRNGLKTTFGQILNPKFETPMNCFLFDYEFWGRLLHDLYAF